MDLETTRVFDFLFHQLEHAPREDALNYKVSGKWKSYSTVSCIEIVNQVSKALLNFGLTKGDKIAIVSENRPEWNFIDLGAQQIGVVSVPMYPTITTADYRYIIDHSQVRMAFVSDAELYQKVKEASDHLKNFLIYSFEQLTDVPNWKQFLEVGQQLNTELQPFRDSIQPDDLMTIIYTSGTTGRPKGVMLSHKNVASNAISVARRFEVPDGVWRALSFLPISHSYERTGIYFFIMKGAGIYYAESIEKIGDNIREIRPHVFNCVPRLLEKIYDKILAKAHELKGIKRFLFFRALDLGLRYEPHLNQGLWYGLQLKVYRKLVFSKWREALGGEIEVISSGGAALQPRLSRVFWAAGIPVLEGYGLTETSPVITASLPNKDDIRVGTVGQAIEGVEIKIASDGEILCKGPNVMMGYYNDPEKTEEVMTGAWFHTGDIGEIVAGKYLRITDRKKEIFKTSGGKYVAPQLMENKFKESEFIESIMVIGEAQRFPSALIYPNINAVLQWAEEEELNLSESVEELIQSPMVIDRIEMEVERVNNHFAQWEKLKRTRIIPCNFSIETGELTPKLSLKRRVIMEKYAHLIAEIYDT
jgi:long-chain acyl-CoA synthetase